MNASLDKRVEKTKQALSEADHILIGGGAGLSAAAGLLYSGPRFTERFRTFIDKYKFTDLYTSSFYPFTSETEKWAYWAHHISLNRYETGVTPLYQDLYRLVSDRSYFVISTNVESQFTKAGFPESRVFEIQGDYGYLQCEKGCHDKLYENEEWIAEMVAHTKNCEIPQHLVPVCPVCGGPMDVNLRKDQHFVQDYRWYETAERYQAFAQQTLTAKSVYLEFGVGFNTPGIIRYPFETFTAHNEQAALIRFNRDHPDGALEIAARTISFTEPINEVVTALLDF